MASRINHLHFTLAIMCLAFVVIAGNKPVPYVCVYIYIYIYWS